MHHIRKWILMESNSADFDIYIQHGKKKIHCKIKIINFSQLLSYFHISYLFQFISSLTVLYSGIQCSYLIFIFKLLSIVTTKSKCIQWNLRSWHRLTCQTNQNSTKKFKKLLLQKSTKILTSANPKLAKRREAGQWKTQVTAEQQLNIHLCCLSIW